MSMQMTEARLSFVTGFLMEAVDEINVTLKNAGYGQRISEDDIVSQDACDGGFAGDARFTFKASLPGAPGEICERLKGTGIDIDFE